MMITIVTSCDDDEPAVELTITSITPEMGEAGASVEINGTGFSKTASEDVVTLTGKRCTVTSTSATKLTITIPADATTGKITVAVGGKTVEGPVFTFIVPLTIESITPATGPKGTTVTINGTGFSSTPLQNTVTLNDKPCEVTAATATQLTIVIPDDGVTGKITVAVGGKTVEGPVFTFIESLGIESITPATGPKGTTVTIKGIGFNSTPLENTVTLNNKPCEVTAASATELTVVIPASAGSGVIKVTVGGVTVESGNFEFVYTTTISTFAGSTYGFEEGTGTAAKLAQPYNVATDAAGNIYISDTNNHRIRKVTPEGVVMTLAGGTQGDADGTGAAAQFNYPYGVATDSDGNVYVADTHNHKVKKITPAGVVTTLAGSTGGYADGTGGAAQFYYLTGVTVDADKNVYVADKDNHKVRKVTSAGVVTTLAGDAAGFADGTGAAAQFNQPYDVAVDGNGNVYVADASNHKIRKVTQARVVTTFAGSTQGDANGTGTAAQFNYPYGIATDADDNVYVADTFSQKVKKITTGGVVTTLAGTTNGNADGDTATAQFNYLTGVDVHSSGKIFIADKDNHRIRAITID